MKSQNFDVFISHKKQDKDLIKPIVTRLLDEYNIRCWLDEWDLTAGKEWEKEIKEALKSCSSCAIFLGSNGWGKSHLKEAKFALAWNKENPGFNIIPVLLPGADETNMQQLGDVFETKHRVHFNKSIIDEIAFQSFRSAIKNEPQGPPSMTIFTIRRDAQRWNNAPNNDKSLLYHGYELQEAQKISSQFPESLNELSIRFLAESATVEQASIQKERKRNRKIFTGLTILILGLIITTAYAVNKQNLANNSKNIAFEKTKIAEQETVRANKEKNAGDIERLRANASANDAAKQRDIAQKQTLIAEHRQKEAEKQKEVAEVRKLEADQQRDSARDQRDRAQLLYYAGHMRMAHEAHLRNDGDRVIEILSGLQPKPGEIDLRSFDWFYYWKLYNKEILTSQHKYSGKQTYGDSIDLGIGDLSFLSKEKLGILLSSPGGHISEVKMINLSDSVQEEKSYIFPANSIVSGNWKKVVQIGQDQESGEKKLINYISVTQLPLKKEVIFKDSLVFDSTNAIDESKKLRFYKAISYDGTTLTRSFANSIEVLDIENGIILSRFEIDVKYISELALSPNGKVLVIGYNDGTIRCWNVDSTEELAKPSKHNASITHIEFSNDGNILGSGDSEGNIQLWNINIMESIPFPNNPHGHYISSITFSNDNKKIASASSGGNIKVWDIRTGNNINTFRPRNFVNDIAFSPDGQILASGDIDGFIKLWNVNSSSDQDVKKVMKDLYGGLAISTKNSLLASNVEDTIYILNYLTGEISKTIVSEFGPFPSLAFSPDGTMLAAGGRASYQPLSKKMESVVVLWDTENWKIKKIISDHRQEVNALTFSPDSKKLASGSIDALLVWSVDSVEKLKTLYKSKSNGIDLISNNCDCSESLSFSPDGKYLASVGGPVQVWHLNNQKVDTLTQFSSIGANVSYSPDGKFLSIMDEEGSINVWDTKEQKIKIKLAGSKEPRIANMSTRVWSSTFSPDGKIIATGLNYRQIKLWNLQLGQELITLTGNHISNKINYGDEQLIRFMTFTPDKSSLISVSQDGTVNIYSVKGNANIYDNRR